MRRFFFAILCSLVAGSARADEAPVPTQAEVRILAETLLSGGCREAQVINRYLAIQRPTGKDMAKVMDSFIAAIPDVLTPQGETINAVDLPSYLWSRMARASESNANDEPLQVGLIALWDASLAYLRGGRISWVAPRRYLPEEAGLREPTSNRRARSLSARRIKPPQSWSVRLVRSGCTRIRSGFSVPGARQETFLEEEAE